MAIKNYKPIEISINGRFREMSEKEAKDFLKWFVSMIPERIRILRHALKETGYDPENLDFSPESLNYLGGWFSKHITTRGMTKDEIERIEKRIPEHLRDHVDIPKRDLSAETLSLCYDIGIYLGEVFRKNINGLEWDIVRKPRNHIDYHKPVLFVDNVPLNPAWVVHTAAVGLIKKSESYNVLYEIYRYWTKDITPK